MKIVELYLNDFIPEKQQEILEAFGDEIGNYDVFPIVTLEFEDKEGKKANN